MSIIEKATAHVIAYFREHYQPPEDPEELDMYKDSWIDDFGNKEHDFPVLTSIELMQVINYCNQHSEHHNFNQDYTTVEDITSLFMRTIFEQLNLITFD